MSGRVRCVALDLDGTLLSDGKHVSKENREALLRAMEQGVHVVIASGRAYASLPQEVLGIPGIEYAITSNGAKIYRVSGQECIRSTRMTAGSVSQIRELAAGRKVTEEVFIDGQPYAPSAYVADPAACGISPWAVPYIQNTRIPVEDMDDFVLTHQGELECLDYVLGNPSELGEIWEMLVEQVPDIYVTSSMENRLEISHRDAGKRAAYEWLLDYLNVPVEEAAAFGDGDNDWEMLDLVGYGIAMENGSAKCKEAAGWVTKKNSQSGVAFGFSEFLHL